jgi:hypothetical protein
MELNTKKAPRVIDEVPYGVYVWEMPDGKWVGDDEGNFLNIASMKGNLKRIAELTAAARSYGITEGGPVFLSGHRQIDDEEYAIQKARLTFGLIPDEHDIPAFREDLTRNYGR